MFSIPQFLDRAKRGAKVDSDYALAKVTGLGKAAISSYRNERTMPDERAIEALCKLSGDDPFYVLTCVQSMRAANDDAAHLWRRLADRLKGTAGAVLIAVVVLFTLSALDLQAPAAAASLTSDCYVKWLAALLVVRFARRWLTRYRLVTA